MRCVPWQVALPVGQEIKYKYVVHSGDQWRWEPGFDRSLPTEGNVRPLVELRDFHRTSGLLSPCSSLLLLAVFQPLASTSPAFFQARPTPICPARVCTCSRAKGV